jgi:acyl carrier protein
MDMATTEQLTSIENDIRHFVIANFLFGTDDGTLTSDESFLENGVIDSTGVLELVAFLEQTYQIKVRDQELIPDNLDSLRKVSAFVQRKLPA